MRLEKRFNRSKYDLYENDVLIDESHYYYKLEDVIKKLDFEL